MQITTSNFDSKNTTIDTIPPSSMAMVTLFQPSLQSVGYWAPSPSLLLNCDWVQYQHILRCVMLSWMNAMCCMQLKTRLPPLTKKSKSPLKAPQRIPLTHVNTNSYVLRQFGGTVWRDIRSKTDAKVELKPNQKWEGSGLTCGGRPSSTKATIGR